MALVIRKYAEGDVIEKEKKTPLEEVLETLEAFQPVENPSVQAAMAPQLKYVIHRGLNEYDPSTVRDYITNDYNLRAWAHNRGLNEVETAKFLLAVQDMLVSGIDAGTLDFLNENSIYVPEQYAGDGKYNIKDTLGGQKIITDDDKAARIEAVNYLKSAFSHGYIQPKATKAHFNADRIIMQALTEKVGNGSTAALLLVWLGYTPLERLRVLRDTLNYLDYLKIFNDYDFSNTDVKNAQELQQRILALQQSFTGGELTNDNYAAAGKAGISILKDLIYGRDKSSLKTPEQTQQQLSAAEQALKDKEEELRQSGLYTEELILQMILAERLLQREAADYRYDMSIHGREYDQLEQELNNLDNDSLYLGGNKQSRYEPDSDNQLTGLENDIKDSSTPIGALAIQISGSGGTANRNQIISNILSKGTLNTQDKQTIANLMYIMRANYRRNDGYVCFGYFPNLGKIVYGDLATLSITTSKSELSGTCINSSDLEEAYKQYTKHKHPNLNYDNYKRTKTASTNNGDTSYKEGGILKAQTGALISSVESLISGAKNLKDTHYENRKQAAVDAGMSEKVFDARNQGNINDLNLEWNDYLRIGAIASDVAALASSFAPGAGTLASGGFSLLGTGADLIADIGDDAVTLGEMWRNLGINLGAAAVGLLPGGKTASIGAKLAKSAKLLTGALAAVGMTSSAMLLNDIVKRGNKYGWDTISKNDWINLSRALTGISSGVAAGSRGFKQYRRTKANSISQLVDRIVVEGSFTGVDGKKLSRVELDPVNDKQLIEQLNAATDNNARVALLQQNGKISNSSSNKIKVLDNRGWFKKLRGKDEPDENTSWYYREDATHTRLMNWDEYIDRNPALKESILDKNGSDVLKELNSPLLKKYLSVLAIENPTSYVKARSDINFMKTVASKAPGSKFRETLDGLNAQEFQTLAGKSQFKNRWYTPAGLQRRIESSYLARPFVNETPVNNGHGWLRGRWNVISSTASLMWGRKAGRDYREVYSNTPFSTSRPLTTPQRTAPNTPEIPLPNVPKPSIFNAEVLTKFNKMFGENGELIKPKAKDKLNALRDKIKQALEKNGGTFDPNEYSDQRLLSEVLERYIRDTKQIHTRTTGSATKKSSNDILNELLDKKPMQFWNIIYRNIDKYTKELGLLSLFKFGGSLFAQNVIEKYQDGGRAKLFSRTLIAGSLLYPLYNWGEYISDNATLENLLNDIYGEGTPESINENLKNYNNYNSEFFKLKSELYPEGFTQGSRFRYYDPVNDYLRTVFNDTKFGGSINSNFKGSNNPRKTDTEKGLYFDTWWGTQQNVRHFGDIENQSNLLNLINSKLKQWEESSDPQLLAKAKALKGLSVTPGLYGDLLYSLGTAQQNPQSQETAPLNTSLAIDDLQKFLAYGNDTDRGRKDTVKRRIDWANIGELARLHMANRTNDALRESYRKDRVALESPVYKLGTIASTYAIENANEDTSNRILASQKNGPLYSDAALNTAALLNAYEQILKTVATNNATRDKYYQENVNANQAIANSNREAGVTTANKNREALVKWYNDYLDHMRDLDVEDFNNRDRWLAGLIQQEIQKRVLENNLNYLNYALNQDYNNVLWKIEANHRLQQALEDRKEYIRREGEKLGKSPEEIEDAYVNDYVILQLILQTKLAGIEHDILSKVGLNNAMLGSLYHTYPYSYENVYNSRNMPSTATPPFNTSINWGSTAPSTGRVTYKKGGKVGYTEDKARLKMIDIMGKEYLDMLKRNSKYVLHKK